VFSLQKTVESANEIAALTFRLTNAESDAADATQCLARLRDKETEHKSAVDVNQAELDLTRAELKRTSTALEVREAGPFIYSVGHE